MSLIKSGNCEKCGKKFYYSFGHPAGMTASFEEQNEHPVTKWFDSFGMLCLKCAPPFEEEAVNEQGLGHGNR